MFAWFQRVLPKTGDFFGMFEAHSATLVGASQALTKLVDGGTPHKEYIAEIDRREHEADDIIREVLIRRLLFRHPRLDHPHHHRLRDRRRSGAAGVRGALGYSAGRDGRVDYHHSRLGAGRGLVLLDRQRVGHARGDFGRGDGVLRILARAWRIPS